MSISGISHLLLIRFWPNFKGRFLGPSLTDVSCHSYICPGNTCPGDICPYHEYLSCYLPNFDQTLNQGFWNHLQQMPTVMVTFVQSYLSRQHLSWQHLSIQEYLSCFLANFDQTFSIQIFGHPIFFTKILFAQNFVWPKSFWIQIFFDITSFWHKFLRQNFLLPKFFR